MSKHIHIHIHMLDSVLGATGTAVKIAQKLSNLQHRAYAETGNRDEVRARTSDPLTKKGDKILAGMIKHYGKKKGTQIFYASRNKGTISGVDGG